MQKEAERFVRAFLNGSHSKESLNMSFEMLIAMATRIFEQLTAKQQKTFDTATLPKSDWHPAGFHVPRITRQQFEDAFRQLVDDLLASNPDQEVLISCGNGLLSLANYIQNEIVGHD